MTIQFSIVIPTFNDLGRLKRSLESARCQTLPCEVVVVDDGSRDGTDRYLRSLGKPIVYYRHPIPIGYAESANAGVELARGNWILLLDDSECLQNDYLERLCQEIECYPKAAIAVSQTLHPNKHLNNHFPDADRVVCIPQEDIHYQMSIDRLGSDRPAPAAFRRDAFLRSGGWRSGSSHTGEAMDAWARIAQYGDAVFVKMPGSDRSRERSDAKLPVAATSLAQNSRGDLEIQYQTIAQVDKKHHDWRANNPAVQRIRKFHWNWMGLKNSSFPGIEGVLPSVSLDAPMPASVEQNARRSTPPSFSNVFHRTVSPKPLSQLSRT